MGCSVGDVWGMREVEGERWCLGDRGRVVENDRGGVSCELWWRVVVWCGGDQE